MKLFLDTSGLLSVFDESDAHHGVCSEFWRGVIRERRYEPVISDYILDEITTRIRHKVSHDKALTVLITLFQLVERGRLRLIWIDETYFGQARSVFERYDDQFFSFTDCTSFAICEYIDIQYAFAVDRDFLIFGLNVLPGPS